MSPENRTALAAWCEQWLGAVPRQVLFERGHSSRVIGVALTDGRLVVVKVRAPAPRITGCVAVQRGLFGAGFPCPEPLAGPLPWGDDVATAETLLPGGAPRTIDGHAPEAFAMLLAVLISSAPPVPAVPSLEPSPPWVGWAHDGAGVWPQPDDLEVDLNVHPGPAWLDELGGRIRARIAGSTTQPVIVGHGDWESHNIGWQGSTALAVFDWDSVVALSEVAIAGAAATVFPSEGPVVAATVGQTEAFLDAYQLARGLHWSPSELEICWAAGLWVLAFNAKKETLGGGAGYLKHLETEARDRMDRAGI